MQIGIISLFPEMFSTLHCGIVGKALDKKIIELFYWNPRHYTQDKHRTVDDRPYGGGPGMLMKVHPLREAIHAAKKQLGDETLVIHVSPQGKPLTQSALLHLAIEQKLIFIASRYEGVDERLLELEVDQEWSIGDYVLSGGEIPVMVMIDALTRLMPEVLGHPDSAEQDSFRQGLLDCPHYTRPEEIEGNQVPSVLLQGNHKEIAQWRLKQSLGRTWLRRPDLLSNRDLTQLEEELLNQFINEHRKQERSYE